MEYIKKSEVQNYIEEQSDISLKQIWNIYCQESQNSDNEIYICDDEFFEIFFSGNIIEGIRATQYGDFNFNDTYVVFNGYGNLDTFNNLGDENSPLDIPILIFYIEENPEQFDIEFEEE